MSKIIDTRKALKDFVGLGLAFETERSESAITDLFNTLCAADRERLMGITSEDVITYSIYYEMTGKLLASRVDQIIAEEQGGGRLYLESVRALLREFGKKLSSLAWTTKEEKSDEQGG